MFSTSIVAVYYVFICFQSVSSCLVEQFYKNRFKILADDSNICVLSKLATVDYLILLELRFSSFFLCEINLICILDILSIML